MDLISEIVLTLFVMNLGISFGAGIYETRIVLPMWFKKSPGAGYQINTTAMRDTDVGRRFWGFATTLPLTLLTIVSIVITWHPHLPGYHLWHIAAVLTLAERIGTFAFFIPNAIKMGKSEEQSPKLSRLASLWMNVNYLRILLTMVAWLVALKAFALVI